jgi:hypothetical protein
MTHLPVSPTAPFPLPRPGFVRRLRALAAAVAPRFAPACPARPALLREAGLSAADLEAEAAAAGRLAECSATCGSHGPEVRWTRSPRAATSLLI